MMYELDGTTIECVYEDLLTNEESVIGQIHLTLTTGMHMDTYMILYMHEYCQEHMKGRSTHLELSKNKVNCTDFSC